MRILCTFVGGLGHLTPLLPVARAARAAGHEVAIAGSGGLVPRIEEAGFRAYATSPAPHHSGTPAGPRPDAPRGHRRASGGAGVRRQLRRPRRAADGRCRARACIEDFRPDLVLRDETDLGTTIAAELLGVPVVTHLVLASGLLVRPELVGPGSTSYAPSTGWRPTPA